jgi:hypothetical protein
LRVNQINASDLMQGAKMLWFKESQWEWPLSSLVSNTTKERNELWPVYGSIAIPNRPTNNYNFTYQKLSLTVWRVMLSSVSSIQVWFSLT